MSAPRQARQKPVPQSAPIKFGTLDTWSNSFPPHGDGGIWSFFPVHSALSLWEGLCECLHDGPNLHLWFQFSQADALSCQHSDSSKIETSTMAVPRKIWILDIESGPLFPPRESWVFPYNYMVLRGELWWEDVSDFLTGLDVASFMLTIFLRTDCHPH